MIGGRDYDEKRNFRRIEVECPGRYRREGESEFVAATVCNLSGGGIALRVERELPVDSLLEVQVVPEQPLMPPLHARVEVVRADGGGAEYYEYGTVIREIVG